MLATMNELGYPVCYDATHSRPNAHINGGQKENLITHLQEVFSAIRFKFSIFIHDNPSKAKSDPNTVLNIKYLWKEF